MARSKTKKAAGELAPQSDPRAPLDASAFLKVVWPLHKKLSDDLVARADASPGVTKALRDEWQREQAAKRTADGYEVWRRGFAGQVASAWVLSAVFVRTLEDRGLLDRSRIAGPGAEDSQKLFFQLAPFLTARDYLLAVFRELSHLPAVRDLFDARHNLVWRLAPSAELADALIALFRQPNGEAPAFRFGHSDSRFLGDLYQDLDEDVRKRYALLQTPDFIERFILDQTLEPALTEFGLGKTNLIDPTCGSGHFLLGAFERLFQRRLAEEPGKDRRHAALAALSAVYGADINPYAVSIARFRLTLAFLDKAGFGRLAAAPAVHANLVVADSLLHGRSRIGQQNIGDLTDVKVTDWRGTAFALEDEAGAKAILGQRYSTVVGNPPYITEKDPAKRELYRGMYVSAHRTFALCAPFTERFFGLSCDGGFVGMINANSVMKREFGKRLIEEFLPTIELTKVIDTSGAYIPGHGTPTVLIFGRSRRPKAATVLTVMGRRGEPSIPANASDGRVWSSIRDHHGELGFENDFVSVVDVSRATFGKHPWSLGGGGAAELKELLEEHATCQLRKFVESPIGRAARVGMDEVYMVPAHVAARIGSPECWRNVLVGEAVRDWGVGPVDKMLFPYNPANDFRPRAESDPAMTEALRHLWRFRTSLASRATFQGFMKDAGLKWFEYMQYTASANRTPLSIAFAFVATHNHFVLDRGGKVFKQSAPIIKLAEVASEDEHLALLAYLNSSTACFWMKQVFYPKGGDQMGDGGRLSATSWEDRFEFASTGLADLPIPTGVEQLLPFGKKLDALAQKRRELHPGGFGPDCLPRAATWRAESAGLLEEMAALQEALDWVVYRLFGLHDDPGLCQVDAADRPGFRACERHLIRRNGGEGPDMDWFRRGGYDLTEAGEPSAAQQRRLAEIASNHQIALIERLDFKRWWRPRDYAAERTLALSDALASAVENVVRSQGAAMTQLRLVGLLPPNLMKALDAEANEIDAGAWTREALGQSAVPYLAAYRFDDAGLEKHAAWQRTWSLQRREDAGEKVHVPVPPKYDVKDYRKSDYWRLRGKLDVPHERFISYPGCESDEDKQPVYGWAGWNHLEQAQALAALYEKRKTDEGWDEGSLTPMLAGLRELIPWIKQWHNEPNQEFGGERLGDWFETFLRSQCHELGLTDEDLVNWRPTKAPGAKKKAAATTTVAPTSTDQSDVPPTKRKRAAKSQAAE